MSKLFKLRSLAAVLLGASAALLFKGEAPQALAVFLSGGLLIESLRDDRKDGRLCVYGGVSLTDIFIPQVYASIQPNDSPETSAFSMSGVAVSNPILQQAAQSGTKKVEVPLWNDLDDSGEPNQSDDTDDIAAVARVNTSAYNCRNAYLNKGFGTTDLVVELSGATPGNGDPMTRIRNRFGVFWQRQFQHRIIAISRGVLEKNIASNGGDMVYDISLQTTVGVTDDNRISADAIVESIFTMGDRFENLGSIAMHSVVYKRLVQRELITFVKDSTGTLSVPVYLGKRVVVDDGMPVIAGTTSGFRYVSVLFGVGAIGYGEGTPKMPVELERFASKGNGGGLENLWERKTWLMHPAGWDWLDASVAGESPTLAELRNPANWNRVLDRKNTPMSFLITNG